MKPYVFVRAPRPTRMAGVLAWLLAFAASAGVGLGTAFVIASVVLGILATWARRRSARPVPPDPPPVPDPSVDPDVEALRALAAAFHRAAARDRSDLPPEHVEARRD